MVLYQIIKGACEDRKEVQGQNPGHSQQLEMRKMRKNTAKETKKEKRGVRGVGSTQVTTTNVGCVPGEERLLYEEAGIISFKC